MRGYLNFDKEVSMGIHLCKYCRSEGETNNRFQPSSTGDVEIHIEVHSHEYKYVVPDLILHYMADHGYSPCPDFIDAVLMGEVFEVVRMQTKSVAIDEDTNLRWFREHGYTPIGYLTGDYNKGEIPPGFLEKLQEIMEGAEGWPLKY